MNMNDDDDGALLYLALVGYANWIETGDLLLSARDAEAQEKKFKALVPSQMRRVLRLRELADACFRGARIPLPDPGAIRGANVLRRCPDCDRPRLVTTKHIRLSEIPEYCMRDYADTPPGDALQNCRDATRPVDALATSK